MSDKRKIIETVDITKIYGMGDISVAALNGWTSPLKQASSWRSWGSLVRAKAR
jgi:hypothetical protein